MTKNSRRIFLVLALILVALLVGLLVRCSCRPASPAPASAQTSKPTVPAPSTARPPTPAPGTTPQAEVLTPATIKIPDHVIAGATFAVKWTGPDNPGDYVTIVPIDAPPAHYENFAETRRGSPLELLAPIQPGACEVRYVAARSRTVLGRAAITIEPAAASLAASEQVVIGAALSVEWTGPNNPNDYITIVPAGTPDGRYLNFTPTAKGSPLTLTALIEPGPAELRYMTGQGAKVLARREITIVAAAVTLDAPPEVIAGASVPVTWTGPNNPNDYITIVPAGTPDGSYNRYLPTAKGPPLAVDAPIDSGPAEIRYMSGQGARVLARRPILAVAPKVTLHAPARAPAGSMVTVEWTGPKNNGDYLTIVPKSDRDGTSLQTAPAARGSPSTLRGPAAPGACEVRYMSGQGNRVLARADIELVAAP